MSSQYKTPFYVKTKSPNGSFTDQETGITVHGHMITKVESPIGKLTMKFLKAGGLVKVEDKEVAKAIAKGRVTEGGAFEQKTKIVMVEPEPGTVAAKNNMKIPVEVPITEDDKKGTVLNHDLDEDDEEEDDEDKTEDEDTEDGEEVDLDAALAAADKSAKVKTVGNKSKNTPAPVAGIITK